MNAAILDPLVSNKNHHLKRLNHIFSCAVESGSVPTNTNTNTTNNNATESSCIQDSLLLMLHLLCYALSHLRSSSSSSTSSSSSSHSDHYHHQQQQQLLQLHATSEQVRTTMMTSSPPSSSTSTFVSSQAPLPTQEHMVTLTTYTFIYL